MSIRLMARVWELPMESHTQKLVLLALADNANDHGDCWPSITTIARKCSLSRQGVLDQIAKLEALKMVQTHRKHGCSNRYRISLPPVNTVDQSAPLTSQADRLPPVNVVDHHQSTPLTRPVYGVDPNHHEPSIEPSANLSESKPSTRAREQTESETHTQARTPTIEEVRGWGDRVMASADCVDCFFNDHEARPLAASGHWTSKDGTPVHNPSAAFRSFATRWKANAAQRQQARPKHQALQRDYLDKYTPEEVKTF
jgi:hypothetical protein